ncbi:MAG: hypothetical protein GY786_11110 [Proteobacteria bacterium]|nr:hypothetical protein [Pseudomonadota bacterium]
MHPLNFNPEQEITIDGKKINRIKCSTCHSMHQGEKGTPALIKTKEVNKNLFCLNCHENYYAGDKVTARKRGIHPVGMQLENEKTFGKQSIKHLDCSTCHSMHNGQKETAILTTKVKNEICVDCHEKQQATGKENARKKGIHPVHFKLENSLKIGDKNLDSMECVSCHSMHKGEKGTPALVKTGKKEFCLNCHENYSTKNLRDARKKGIHPTEIKLEKPINFGKQDISFLKCTTCHSTHDGKENTALLSWKGEGEICRDCHQKQHANNRKEAKKKGTHPVSFKPEKDLRINNHKVEEVLCSSCHSPHQGHKGTPGLVQPFKNQDETLCRSCHEEYFSNGKKDAYPEGIHPTGIRVEEEIKLGNVKLSQLRCTTCHSIHEGNENSVLTVKELSEDLCKSCHPSQFAKDQSDAKIRGIHPLNMNFKNSAGESQDLTCLSCHSVHKGVGKTHALIKNSSSGDLCAKCHAAKISIKNSDHDLRVTAPKSQNTLKQSPEHSGLCGTCHSMHRSENKLPFLYVGSHEIRSEHNNLAAQDQLCTSCHHEKGIARDKGLKRFDHPIEDLILRSSDKSLPVFNGDNRIDEFGEIRCVTCHDPHRWSSKSLDQGENKSENRKGNILNSFLRRRGLKGIGDTFCERCHGLETKIKYKYYHKP